MPSPDHHVSSFPALPFRLARRGLPYSVLTPSSTIFISLPGTSFALSVTSSSSPPWTVSRRNAEQLMLHIPATAPVGLYNVKPEGAAEFQLAILFNPFSPEDDVYVADARERDEYVMNETGMIWRGSWRSNFPTGWNYAQFSEPVIKVALQLLRGLDESGRKDVVKVSRHLSAAVNVQDEGGVLVGRWDGEYSDGKPPTAWAGSKAICKTYLETGRPVKYGQCWVFAGVLTSVCRALGIASRVVTNFASAHDTSRPYNRAVDEYFAWDGTVIEEKSRDSVWNFHVWTGAWMKRHDLKSIESKWGVQLGGWQAIDATPQEVSDGAYQMGPASVTAVKYGIGCDYDVDFVVGEVNADVVHYWQEKEGTDQFKVIEKRTRSVGKTLSTKKVGSDARNDITLEYKFAEGTKEEREALLRRPSAAIEPIELPSSALAFTLNAPALVRYGDIIKCSVTVKNNGNEAMEVRLSGLLRAIRYTGSPTGTIKKESHVLKVDPGKQEIWDLEVAKETYASMLVRDVQVVKVNFGGRSGDVRWTDESVVRVYGDEMLEVDSVGRVYLGEKGSLQIKLKNDFGVELTGVSIEAECDGLVEPVTLQVGTVKSGVTKTVKVGYHAEKVGEKVIVINVDSEQLQDVSKVIKVKVFGEMPWWRKFLQALFCKQAE